MACIIRTAEAVTVRTSVRGGSKSSAGTAWFLTLRLLMSYIYICIYIFIYIWSIEELLE